MAAAKRASEEQLVRQVVKARKVVLEVVEPERLPVWEAQVNGGARRVEFEQEPQMRKELSGAQEAREGPTVEVLLLLRALTPLAPKQPYRWVPEPDLTATAIEHEARFVRRRLLRR